MKLVLVNRYYTDNIIGSEIRKKSTGDNQTLNEERSLKGQVNISE
jgi:hypothetical protein